jgi:CPA2 family monovalent cation:H+ antiporter-2
VILAIVMGILMVGFWRSTTNLQGHVRAGAQVLLDALAAQTRRAQTAPPEESLEQVHALLPGLGALVAVRLDPGSAAIGKTLAQLKLRGRTGATVLAVTRAQGGVIVPTAAERLQAGDVLALAGTHDAIAAARASILGMKQGA